VEWTIGGRIRLSSFTIPSSYPVLLRNWTADRRAFCSDREEIDEAHSKLRENLRGFSRKRHRESVKRTKKKGSGAGNRRREGGLGGFTLDSTLAEE